MRLGSSTRNWGVHLARPAFYRTRGEHSEVSQRDPVTGYPMLRPMPGPESGFTPELLWRVESTNGEVTLGDTNATIFTASGTPDKWRVTARAFGALVVLTNILDQEESAVLVPAGETIELYVPRRRIRARNATAASNATLSAEAFFRGPVFSFDAR